MRAWKRPVILAAGGVGATFGFLPFRLSGVSMLKRLVNDEASDVGSRRVPPREGFGVSGGSLRLVAFFGDTGVFVVAPPFTPAFTTRPCDL